MAKRKLSLSRMKAISEAYEKIQAIEGDILDIQATAERLLDTSSRAWISLDLEDDLIKEMAAQTWTTTTASGSFFVSSESSKGAEDNGFSVDIPDTVALEILGVILRHKQQLIENENNNI